MANSGRPIGPLLSSLLTVAALLSPALAPRARAHETNFGISPDTIFKRGWEIEFNHYWTERTGTRRGSRRTTNWAGHREREFESELEAGYGVQENLTLGAALPWMSMEESRNGEDERTSGVGSPHIFGKYRFYKRDVFQGTNYASLIGRYTIAGGRRTDDPPLSDGHDTFLLGLGGSHIRQHWAFWANGGRQFTERRGGERPGDADQLNLAAGWRPRVAELDELDWQGLLEFNYERQERTDDDDGEANDSGHRVWFVSPGFRTGYGRSLLNFGIQIPLAQDWKGEQLGIDYRLKVGWVAAF